ncbi:MAG: FecR domain-containing protein [Balneolales bacterium]
MKNNQIPENDPDLQLAQKLGQTLESHRNPAEIEDPLMPALMAYKQKNRTEELSIPAGGRNVWDRIAGETMPVTVKIYNLANKTKVWATAATLLIAVFIAAYYNYQSNQPTLLASSGAQIESLQLQGGSEVTLRPHSSFYMIRENETEQRYRLKGEGYFSVASRPDRMFTVESEHGRAEVLGTRFVMRDWGELTQIFLEEGEVRFETADRRDFIVLQPGQSSSISTNEGLLKPKVADIDEFLDWTRNELLFNSRSVNYIFKELEHHFQISIEAPEAITSDVLGGAISLEDQKQSLNDLGTVLNGRFITDDDIKYTFIPN